MGGVLAVFGSGSDWPIAADFDGDGKTDITVWRPETGQWWAINSSLPQGGVAATWGAPGDVPISGDFNGDGKADVTVWRPSTGSWYNITGGDMGAWGGGDAFPLPFEASNPNAVGGARGIYKSACGSGVSDCQAIKQSCKGMRKGWGSSNIERGSCECVCPESYTEEEKKSKGLEDTAFKWFVCGPSLASAAIDCYGLWRCVTGAAGGGLTVQETVACLVEVAAAEGGACLRAAGEARECLQGENPGREAGRSR